jgi:hypothetical protein
VGYHHKNINVLVYHVVYLGDLFTDSACGKLDDYVPAQFLGRPGKNLDIFVPPFDDKCVGSQGKTDSDFSRVRSLSRRLT